MKKIINVFIIMIILTGITTIGFADEEASGKIEKVNYYMEMYEDLWSNTNSDDSKFEREKVEQTETKVRDSIYEIEDKDIRKDFFSKLEKIKETEENRLLNEHEESLIKQFPFITVFCLVFFITFIFSIYIKETIMIGITGSIFLLSLGIVISRLINGFR